MPMGDTSKKSWFSRHSTQKLEFQRLETNEFRLVRIFPGESESIIKLAFLPPASLSQPPAYHALSYTWGNPFEQERVSIDGVVVKVTKTLEAFLRHHREDLRDMIGVLWIDAICINQKDYEEKNLQLSLMRQIYENSHSTIVWLGPKNEDLTKGLHLIDEVPRPLPLGEAVALDIGDIDLSSWLENKANRALAKESWISFYRLMSLPWFSRIWTKQEYILSPIVTFQLGNIYLSPHDLFPVAFSLPKAKGTREIIMEIQIEEKKSTKHIAQGTKGAAQILQLTLDRNTRKLHLFDPMEAVLWRLRDNDATNPRDKIYGILGLTAPPDVFLVEPTKIGYNPDILIIDYNAKVEDIYKSLVNSIISATKKVNIICASQPGLILGVLPSWVPDWTRHWETKSLLEEKVGFRRKTGKRAFTASRSSNAIASFSDDLRILRIQGVVVDSISRIWGSMTKEVNNVEMMYRALATEYTRNAREWRESRTFNAYGSSTESDKAHWHSLTIFSSVTQDERTNGRNNDSDYESWSLDFDDWILNDYSTDKNPDMFLGFMTSIRGRRTMIGEKGYVISGPKRARIGDLVCVLFGCDVPVVLRSYSRGKYFEFVGECYCYGMMAGEVMDQLGIGLLTSREFELR